MIWNAIVDHIPTWGWVVIIGVPILAAFYFASPILIPLWNMMPTPLKLFLGAIGAGMLAYLGGRYKGRKDAEDADARRDQVAIQKRSEVDARVDKMPVGQAEQTLRNKWSAPDDPAA
jgi:hypothetical protein